MRPEFLVLVLLGAGSMGTGTTFRPGVEHHHIMLGPAYVSANVMANPVVLEWTAPDRGHVSSLTWNEYVSGNPGENSQSYSLEVNGVAQCSITFSCDTSARVEQACDVLYSTGDVLTIRRTGNTCAMNPSGGILVTTS